MMSQEKIHYAKPEMNWRLVKYQILQNQKIIMNANGLNYPIKRHILAH